MIAMVMHAEGNPRGGLGAPTISKEIYRKWAVPENFKRVVAQRLREGTEKRLFNQTRNSFSLSAKGRRHLLPNTVKKTAKRKRSDSKPKAKAKAKPKAKKPTTPKKKTPTKRRAVGKKPQAAA
eukprot:CAMPEP_0174255514 /NCGR_PEP_ID=MMETSP0439-20130205/4847_1 /TAXON_ID=0 /ORGANISM="Stereomyxa ramosa, Strain Chinc5" /LENGTH=122 /DNA_ID=CAMNT_0015337737 /DNA_START=164 /DNA_END=528 /DNA_ORIENTATION=+